MIRRKPQQQSIKSNRASLKNGLLFNHCLLFQLLLCLLIISTFDISHISKIKRLRNGLKRTLNLLLPIKLQFPQGKSNGREAKMEQNHDTPQYDVLLDTIISRSRFRFFSFLLITVLFRIRFLLSFRGITRITSRPSHEYIVMFGEKMK